MSDPLRIALVAEGDMEREVLTEALKVILAPRTFVLTQLQPETTLPNLRGNGWGGVLKWCAQLAAASPGAGQALEDDPTLSTFDGIVLQLDADVATFAYHQLRPALTDEQVTQRGWLPLPCATAAPPPSLDEDALFAVLQSWLKPAVPGKRTVVCIPAMNTGAWQAAALLPSDDPLRPGLESCLDIEARLQRLPLHLKVDKKMRASRLRAAAAVGRHWHSVTQHCSRAQAFDRAVRAAFPPSSS